MMRRVDQETPRQSLGLAHRRRVALAIWSATLVALSCRGSEVVDAPSSDAGRLFLRAERMTDPDDRVVVIPPQGTARLQAILGDDGGASASARRVAAHWQSSDTSVVRIESADSVATLRYLAPGTSVITAAYTSADTTWRGAVRLRVVERTP